jgi:hypothetical protein
LLSDSGESEDVKGGEDGPRTPIHPRRFKEECYFFFGLERGDLTFSKTVVRGLLFPNALVLKRPVTALLTRVLAIG